ncbi:MAG TPA: DUF4912 domain-containing protein [Gemmataceae bacterium]|nr:DUF4912 domain-containing protein [Gemmataceae bacterium]
MTRDQLQACTKKTLRELARDRGIPGWHAMSKEELVAALAKPSRSSISSNHKANGSPRLARPTASRGRNAAPPQAAAARDTSNASSGEEQVESSKYHMGIPTRDLSAKVPKDLPAGYGKDRIALMVRDPYWLHCYWELTHQAIQRAEAALDQEWHSAKPILRLLDVSSRDITSTSETIIRDIEIHGGCNNWYIDVANPPRSYRVDIGYLARSGKFYALARSNVVTTPRAGISDVIDENWADIDAKKADRIYAMSSGFDPSASSLELKQLFEEHLRRPLGSPAVTSFGSGGLTLGGKPRKFWFHLDAELIVYGATEPNSRVTLQGQPVKLRPDGTFTMRFSLPDNRQIIPAVAVSPDGIEERTIVLAVERNTKALEPMIHEDNE